MQRKYTTSYPWYNPVYMKRWCSFFLAVFFLLYQVPATTTAQTPPPVSSALPTPTPAIEYALPYPGLLPGQPLYAVKQWRDRILLFFTRDAAKKSTLLLLLADKKLAMVLQLIEQQKFELAAGTLAESQDHLLSGTKLLIALKQDNMLPVGLAEKFDTASRKHTEILSGLEKNPSTRSIRERIEQAQTILSQAKQYILSVRQ